MNRLVLVLLGILVFFHCASNASEIETVKQACTQISNKLASVSQKECLALELSSSGYLSVNGFHLLMKEYPPLPTRKPMGRILLVGGTHGDELSSISVVFKWMKTLQQHHSGLFHWRINPLMNPDGALQSRHSRVNARGVDLNRNFVIPESPDDAALTYWINQTKRDIRRYPGPYPLSEPETYWLYKEIQSFKPDVIIAVHAPFSLVDYDAPDRKKAPERIGYLYKDLLGTYPGSLGNYAGLNLGIPVITLELPYAGIMPGNRQIRQMWRGLIRWLINYL